MNAYSVMCRGATYLVHPLVLLYAAIGTRKSVTRERIGTDGGAL